jgi:hypothetical protein
LSEPSPAVERVARGMAREAWGGVADEAALARMVGHGWRAFVELAEFAMGDTLAMMREEVRDHTLVRRDVERITADRARRWGPEGRERA